MRQIPGAKRATTIDHYLAAKLLEARIRAGMTQTDLAGRLGVSFQQIQKYEKAKNKISAAMLVEAAAAFGLEIAWFFEGIALKGDQAMDAPAPLSKAEREMIADFAAIKDNSLRSLIRQSLRYMAHAKEGAAL